MPTSVIRPDILAQTAYHVADAPADFIKLDAMEVPYQFPEALRAELAAEGGSEADSAAGGAADGSAGGAADPD